MYIHSNSAGGEFSMPAFSVSTKSGIIWHLDYLSPKDYFGILHKSGNVRSHTIHEKGKKRRERGGMKGGGQEACPKRGMKVHLDTNTI